MKNKIVIIGGYTPSPLKVLKRLAEESESLPSLMDTGLSKGKVVNLSAYSAIGESKLLLPDYSNIELKVFAELIKSKNTLDIDDDTVYNKDKDKDIKEGN